MKNDTTGWVEPFKFNKKQRADIFKILGNSTKLNDIFIERTEQEIELWLAFLPPISILPTTGNYQFDRPLNSLRPRNYKEKFSQISNSASNLQKLLNTSALEYRTSIIAETDKELLLNKSTDIGLPRTIKNYNNTFHQKRADYNFYPLLNDLLDLLITSSDIAETKINDRGGVYNPDIKQLIGVMSELYENTFNKKPAYSKNTIFVSFMNKIGDIFSIAISTDAIKSILKN